jgi:uncharacterized membrane protein YoaK (UPF0700 family)
MLLHQGSSRKSYLDRRLAWILAAIAGALNTAIFHAIGFFAANMTGNVSAVSNHLAFGDWWLGLFYLSILLVFILGAMAATLLVGAGHRHHITSIYAVGILVEALLMALLGAVCLQLATTLQNQVLVLGVSFLMGLQNALVTRISNARVRTTHVSGMSTDIGIELGVLMDVARGAEPPLKAPKYRNRLQLHSQTLLAFLLGGVAGVVVYQWLEVRILFVIAALLLAMALRAFWRARKLVV